MPVAHGKHANRQTASVHASQHCTSEQAQVLQNCLTMSVETLVYGS